MAIDLGSTNTTRYYSVPDSADFSLPNGDWAWVNLCYFPSGMSTAEGYYLVSTNTVSGANSFNLFITTVAQQCGVVVNTGAVLEVTGAPPKDKWFYFYATRRSGNLYVGHCALDASAASESAAQALAAASNGVLLYLGSRSDALGTRFWKGRMGYSAFVSGSGVTTDDVLALAKGAPLLSMPFASNIVEVFHGRTASSTFSGLIKGHVATRQGTTYGTNEEDRQTAYLWTPDYISGVTAAPGGSSIPVFVNHYRNQGIM